MCTFFVEWFGRYLRETWIDTELYWIYWKWCSMLPHLHFQWENVIKCERHRKFMRSNHCKNIFVWFSLTNLPVFSFDCHFYTCLSIPSYPLKCVYVYGYVLCIAHLMLHEMCVCVATCNCCVCISMCMKFSYSYLNILYWTIDWIIVWIFLFTRFVLLLLLSVLLVCCVYFWIYKLISFVISFCLHFFHTIFTNKTNLYIYNL